MFSLLFARSFCANEFKYDYVTNTLVVTADSEYTADQITELFPEGRNWSTLIIKGTYNIIPLHAFDGSTQLANLIIEAPIEKIMGYAFCMNLELTTFTVPENVTYIGNYAFYGCTKLKTFYYRKGTSYYNNYAFNGCENLVTFKPVDGDASKPAKEVTFANFTFYACSKLSDVEWPENLVALGENCFNGCTSMKNIPIPNNLKELPAHVFEGCFALEEVDLKNVEILVFKCFSACTNLKKVTFGKTFRRIGPQSFDSCSSLVELVGLESNLDYVFESGAFAGCLALKSFIVPNMTIIPDYAFNACPNLSSITFLGKVQSIGKYALFGTGFTTFTLPDSVQMLGQAALSGMKELTQIIVTENNQFFKTDATLKALWNKEGTMIYLYPQGNELTSVTIPDTVTDLTDYAFAYAKNIKSITFSKNLETIGMHCFNGCSGLIRIEVPEKVMVLFDYAFAYCSSLTEADISHVISLCDNAFYECKSLAKVKIASNIGNIMKSVFEGCPLNSIELPENLTYIGESAFKFANFKTIVLPKKLRVIAQNAFFYNRQLTEIKFGPRVEQIWSNAFAYCTSLKSIELPESLQTIGSGAFNNTAISNLVIPFRVTRIQKSAFAHNSKLQTVEIRSENLSRFGSGVFDKDIGLHTIKFLGNIVSMDDNALSGTMSLKTIIYCSDMAVGGMAVINHEPQSDPIEVQVASYYNGTEFAGQKVTQTSICPPLRTPIPSVKPKPDHKITKKVIIIASCVVVGIILLTGIIVGFVVKGCMKRTGWVKKETLTESLLTQTV